MYDSNADYISRFRQIVPTRTEELHNIRQVVENEALQFGFDPQTAFHLALAVDEACTNIIKHSYEGNPAETFDVEIATYADRFMVILTDRGKAFNPKNAQKLDMKRYFEQMRRGGLGVHIIHLVMDDVDYATTSSQVNQLRMVKHLNTANA